MSSDSTMPVAREATGLDRRTAVNAMAAAGLALGWGRPSGAQSASAPVLRFAGGRDAHDRRTDDVADLLQRVLQAAGRPERVEVVGGVPLRRQVADLERGALDVMHLGSGHPALTRLPVLRSPLRRGLPGVRLLVTRRDLALTLSRARQVADLQPWRLGYGAGWGDLATMEALGFRVVTGDTYTGLYRMLQDGRFDWLHRGVHEVWSEAADPALMGDSLVVVPGVALQYPLDHYFALSPQRGAAWRDLLARGLAVLQASGGYQAWFQRWHGEAVRRADLAQRHLLRLTDYRVPPGTPVQEFDLLRPTKPRRLP